jgi:hypothetical protein
VIPHATIKALFPTMTEPLWMTTYVTSGSHTTSTYKGKTLDGYNVLTRGHEETTFVPEG